MLCVVLDEGARQNVLRAKRSRNFGSGAPSATATSRKRRRTAARSSSSSSSATGAGAPTQMRGEGEESDGDEACAICHSTANAAQMLLCGDGVRGCDRGFHMQCLSPPLDALPPGDWFCPECADEDEDGEDEEEEDVMEDEDVEDVEIRRGKGGRGRVDDELARLIRARAALDNSDDDSDSE